MLIAMFLWGHFLLLLFFVAGVILWFYFFGVIFCYYYFCCWGHFMVCYYFLLLGGIFCIFKLIGGKAIGQTEAQRHGSGDTAQITGVARKSINKKE
jgi:hypothetical protein